MTTVLLHYMTHTLPFHHSGPSAPVFVKMEPLVDHYQAVLQLQKRLFSRVHLLMVLIFAGGLTSQEVVHHG